MGKLHEVLAVEGDLAATAKRILDEARSTFSNKHAHFLGETQVTTYFDEAERNLDTSESKPIDTTVQAKLDYVAPVVSRYWDAYFSKEATNQQAKAEIVVDGQTFATDVPATVLLGMETKLKELRSVYEAIPTLQPGFDWERDEQAGEGVYVAKDVDRFVTKNTVIPVVLAPATDRHPAQVQTVNRDVPVARRVTQKSSGMLSPAEKSDLLEKIDKLIRAVKEARQRANTVEAQSASGFGKKFFDFIHG